MTIRVCIQALLISSAVVFATGCEDKGAAAGTTGGAATAGATGAKPASTGSKPAANKTVKAADVKAAYEAEINDMKKMKDPMDKKIAAFVAKIGEPAKTEGDKKVWYSVDGDKCQKVVLGTDGSLTETTTDKAECGL